MTTALLVRLQTTIAQLKDERGAAMAEYGLLLTLVALAAIGVLSLFGGEIVEIFTEAEIATNNRGNIPPPD